MAPGDTPSVHLYVDGSWDPQRDQGGYGIAAVLEHHGHQAIFGVLGDGTQGHTGTTPWLLQGPPALENEQLGIAVALLWLLQTCSFIQFKEIWVRFDCMSAGLAANGTAEAATCLAKQIRALQHFATAVLRKEPKFSHVKAHQGEPLNELVDVIAKSAAKGSDGIPRPPDQVCRIFKEADITWLAAAHEEGWRGAIPVDHCALRWQTPTGYGPSPLRSEQLVPTTQPRSQCHSRASFDSVTLSLNALGTQGKERYFEDQLDSLGVHIAFLQETKTAGGCCQSARFLRLSTPAERHWGVAIWISRQRGVGYLDGRPWLVDEADIRILAQTERLLVALITKGTYKLVAVSGHCPHDAKFPEAQQFLKTVHHVVGEYKHAHLIVAGFDLNGPPTPGVMGVTGSLSCGDEDRIGALATTVFGELSLWLPSTFAELHHETTETYRHPQGTQHRIDFAALGGTAHFTQVDSFVSHVFDSGAERDDHWPVCLAFSADLAAGKEQARIKREKFDIRSLMTPAGRCCFAAELALFEHPPWECHPDRHYQLLQDFILDIMRRRFPLPDNRPRASFISQSTWTLRDRKQALKLKTGFRRNLWRDLLHRALLRWRGGSECDVQPLLHKQSLLYQLSAAAISIATQRIKKEIANSKSVFLRELAGSPSQPPGALLRQAKAAGVGGAKARPVARPLPQLQMQDGTMAASRRDRDTLWAHHFAKQELGRHIATEDYLRQPSNPPFLDAEITWQAQDFLSLNEVETAVRQAPRRKSAGLDNICGEMLLAAPGPVAKLLFPLFTKATANLCQPAQFRGGILYEAYKRSGCSWDPQSYRSLFVSSVVGKCYHKAFRTKSQQAINRSLHDFHMGAKKGCPVTMPALYILAHQRRGREQKRSVATLYLDTEAAYYKVTRQLAFGNLENDDSVVRVFQHFGLEPSDITEMMEQVLEGGMAADAGLSAATRHCLKDFHSRAWFVTMYADGSRVTQTSAGSRPGESWSDIVFGWVYSRILAKITEHAVAEDLIDVLPVDPSAGPYAGADGGMDAVASDATCVRSSSSSVSSTASSQTCARENQR